MFWMIMFQFRVSRGNRQIPTAELAANEIENLRSRVSRIFRKVLIKSKVPNTSPL